jgi:Tfp pilus assembly protein PilF
MKSKVFFLGIAMSLVVAGCGKKKQEQDAQFWYNAALQELQLGQRNEVTWRAALSTLANALAMDDKQADYHLLKGSLLLLLDMPALSLQIFEYALTLPATPGKKAEILNNYACALAQIGREEQAFVAWEQALAQPAYLTPELVYCNQGQHWLRKNEWGKALSAFDRAVNLVAEYSDAHFYRAVTLFYLKRYAKAHDAVVTLLAFDPDYQAAVALKKELASYI